MDAPQGLTRYRRAVETYMQSLLRQGEPAVLYRMLRYHLGWEEPDGRPAAGGGKGLRASLCLLACEAAGAQAQQAMPAAAAVELVHNFSLIHDDVQDRDRERRHRPTVWSVWGDAQAINAGDAMLALARLALLNLRHEGASVETVLAAAELLDQRTLEMVEGQTMDIAFEKEERVDLTAYLLMVEKKTGALMDCALRLGALAAGAPAVLVEGLGQCGRLLGTAFQVRDDILGVWGDPAQTGKAAGADIRRRKKSLPIVYALWRPEGEAIRRIYARADLTDEDVGSVPRLLESCGAREYCEGVARERRDAALAALDRLPLRAGPAQDLREAAVFLAERQY